jgi:hypothetical protein
MYWPLKKNCGYASTRGGRMRFGLSSSRNFTLLEGGGACTSKGRCTLAWLFPLLCYIGLVLKRHVFKKLVYRN